MKFTFNWLQEYVDTGGKSAAEIADYLTMLGLEVDAVTELFPELAPLMTAQILSTSPHPESDHLQVCEVAVGSETLQIVCGAPNAREGLVTAIALPGMVLPDGNKIKASKVRGIPSSGMLCSERELGLSTDHAGILELPENTPHGQSFIQAVGLADTMIEVDLTPNRPDCASVIGIAREIAGITGRSLCLPVKNAEISVSDGSFSVEVESPDLCPRYAARLIKGIQIGPSPVWLRNRLLAIGQRSINNIVDITNYVMMEYGQPLHAFDFKNLVGGKIIVRTPHPTEETFTTLDGVERKISSEMLMICDSERPVAVAGIMGGMNSEVGSDTTDILLESACFNPVSVRKTARALNLATEASYRFERGVDPDGVLNAMERAVILIQQIAGGNCGHNQGIDLYKGRKQISAIPLRISRTSSLIGMDLDYNKITGLLESINILCSKKDEDTILVMPPSFRVDIEREADLVEEVARLIGYDAIPTSLPCVNLSYPEQEQGRLTRQQACRILTSIGFSEAINYSFSAEDHLDKMNLTTDDKRRSVVRLLNPLSEEQAVLRTMLLPGLLENVKRNINFQKTAIKLFEVGKVFHPTSINEQPIEKTHIAGVLSGNVHGSSSPLHYKPQLVNIYDAKGAVEFLLDELRLLDLPINPITFSIPSPEQTDHFADPLQTLLVHQGSQLFGTVGKFNNDTLRRFGIKHDVYYFDLDFDTICTLEPKLKSFSTLPIYPAVKRDISLLVPVHISAGDLHTAIANSNEKLIEHCEIFDIYTGEPIKEGWKSVALSLTYRSANKTLTEKNVEKSHYKIVDMLTSKFNGTFREA
jgi:phenylalanyl-tRNA synthetase beta chain